MAAIHPTVVKVTRIADKTLVETFKRMVDEEGLNDTVSNVNVRYLSTDEQSQIKSFAEEQKLLMTVLSFDAYSIANLTIAFRGFTVLYFRPHEQIGNDRQKKLTGWNDEVTITSSNDQYSSYEKYLKIVAAIRKHFQTVDDKDYKAVLPDHMQEFYSGQNQAIQQQKEVLADLTRQSAELISTLSKQTVTKHQELESHFSQKEK